MKWEKVEQMPASSRSPVGPGDLQLMKEIELMFLGQYQHSLDDKGRLTIPSRYRELLGEGAFITQGFDRNLMVLPADKWQQVYDHINTMSLTDPSTRLLRRMIFSNAYPAEVDRAGRILVPQGLRQFLGLNGEASVVGQGEYFEIWSPANWAEQMGAIQDVDANTARFTAFNLTTQK
jgi:MraZ protein